MPPRRLRSFSRQTLAPEHPALRFSPTLRRGGRSRNTKAEGSRLNAKNGGVFNSKQAHVGMVQPVRRKKIQPGTPLGFVWVDVLTEVEHLAAFDGPTCEDAAREFVKLYQRGLTPSNGAHCKADGPRPATAKRWNEKTALITLIA